jgi:hypothetical protein
MRFLARLALGLSLLWSLAACGTTRIAVEAPAQSTRYQRGTNAIIDQQIREVEEGVPEQRQASQKTYYLIPSSGDVNSQNKLIDTLKSYYRERTDWSRETSVGETYFYAASNGGKTYLIINLVPLTGSLLLIEGITQE